jgi:hypothetical protein
VGWRLVAGEFPQFIEPGREAFMAIEITMDNLLGIGINGSEYAWEDLKRELTGVEL